MYVVNSVKSVEFDGVEYKKQALVAIKPTTDFEEPSFGLIKEIYAAGSTLYFYIQEMETEDYSEHYCVYVITNTQNFRLISIDSIVSYLPLSTHKLAAFPGYLCTIPKFKII